jgi:hypothetical protein
MLPARIEAHTGEFAIQFDTLRKSTGFDDNVWLQHGQIWPKIKSNPAGKNILRG